jgi:UDP:flavonoid glycosyltransferase YjiC (YdhE family)
VKWISYVDFYFGELYPITELWPQQWNALRTRLGLARDPRPSTEARWLALSPHLILLLGLRELMRFSSPLPPYVHAVGPLLWDPPLRDAPPPWLKRLGRDQPAVLVSTSSAFLDDADLVTLAAEALDGEDVDVVATVPAEQQLGPLPPHVVASRYVPHSLLLPRVQALLCSAGLHVIGKAVMAGVPVVAVPRGADGHLVAKAASDAGVAIELARNGLDAARLRAALREAMSDARRRNTARAIAESSRRCNAPATAADLIEGVLAS